MKININAGADDKARKIYFPYVKKDSVVDFVFFSNIGVGLCTTGVALLYTLMQNAEVSFTCLTFIFSATTLIYNLDHLDISREDRLNAPQRCRWVERHTTVIVRVNTALLSVILWIVYVNFSWSLLFISLALLISCLGYKYKLKKIPLMKNLIVPLVWSQTVCVIPTLWSEGSLSGLDYTLLYFYFGIAFLNTIFFDIRDFAGDNAAGIKSIVVVCGPSHSKKFLTILALNLFIICLINKQLVVFSCIPASYIFLNYCKGSRLKYFVVDLLLASPLIFWI